MALAVEQVNGASRDLSAIAEQVLISGDLARLGPAERVQYYHKVCASLGLNPLTRPFEYLKLSGREILYAKKDATDQLRNRHRVSLQIVSRETVGDLYVVTAGKSSWRSARSRKRCPRPRRRLRSSSARAAPRYASMSLRGARRPFPKRRGRAGQRHCSISKSESGRLKKGQSQSGFDSRHLVQQPKRETRCPIGFSKSRSVQANRSTS